MYTFANGARPIADTQSHSRIYQVLFCTRRLIFICSVNGVQECFCLLVVSNGTNLPIVHHSISCSSIHKGLLKITFKSITTLRMFDEELH